MDANISGMSGKFSYGDNSFTLPAVDGRVKESDAPSRQALTHGAPNTRPLPQNEEKVTSSSAHQGYAASSSNSTVRWNVDEKYRKAPPPSSRVDARQTVAKDSTTAKARGERPSIKERIFGEFSESASNTHQTIKIQASELQNLVKRVKNNKLAVPINAHTLLAKATLSNMQETLVVYQEFDKLLNDKTGAENAPRLHLYNNVKQMLEGPELKQFWWSHQDYDYEYFGKEENIPKQFWNDITAPNAQKLSDAALTCESLTLKLDPFFVEQTAKLIDKRSAERSEAFDELNYAIWNGDYPGKKEDVLKNPQKFIAENYNAISLALGCVGTHISILKRQMAQRDELKTNENQQQIQTTDAVYKKTCDVMAPIYDSLKDDKAMLDKLLQLLQRFNVSNNRLAPEFRKPVGDWSAQQEANFPNVELPHSTASNLRHKHPNIDNYLNGISGNIDEKNFVLDRIAARLPGLDEPPTVLEIGVGGGECLEEMLKTANNRDLKGIKFIGVDIDQTVIDKAIERHPTLGTKWDGIDLSFHCADAKNLDGIDNNSVNFINASAVVHEIYSYGGGTDAVRQFFHACLRVLKPGGELVYRDPLSPRKPEEFIKLISLSPEAKMFYLFFVPFFFSSRNEKEDVDNVMHDSSTLRQLNESIIRIFLFNQSTSDKALSSTRVELTMAEFLNTPLSNIDMSKGLTINCGNLVAHELTRHFTVLCNFLKIAGVDIGNIIDLKQASKQEGLLVKDFPDEVQKDENIGSTLKKFLNGEGVESYYYASPKQLIAYSKIQSEDGYAFRTAFSRTILRDSYNKRLGNHFSMNTVGDNHFSMNTNGDYAMNKVRDGKRLFVFEKTAVKSVSGKKSLADQAGKIAVQQDDGLTRSLRDVRLQAQDIRKNIDIALDLIPSRKKPLPEIPETGESSASGKASLQDEIDKLKAKLDNLRQANAVRTIQNVYRSRKIAQQKEEIARLQATAVQLQQTIEGQS